MKLTLKDIKGQNLGDLEIAFPVIENGRGSQAVHDSVVAFQANQRMGTACTKTMGEVNGTGKKPWRQKGTGRARAHIAGARNSCRQFPRPACQSRPPPSPRGRGVADVGPAR